MTPWSCTSFVKIVDRKSKAYGGGEAERSGAVGGGELKNKRAEGFLREFFLGFSRCFSRSYKCF